MKTYRELLERLQNLTQEQLSCDITVYDNNSDEFMGLEMKLEISDARTNVLDEGHPFFTKQ